MRYIITFSSICVAAINAHHHPQRVCDEYGIATHIDYECTADWTACETRDECEDAPEKASPNGADWIKACGENFTPEFFPGILVTQQTCDAYVKLTYSKYDCSWDIETCYWPLEYRA